MSERAENPERFDGRLACRFDPARLERTPAFVVDTGLLRDNLAILGRVKAATGCKILLALKCFALFRVFPLLAETLDGVCCSSPHEARLGREEFGREVHSFAAAYSAADMEELALTSDHIVFNSLAQKARFLDKARDLAAQYGKPLAFGLRLNPEHSEGTTPLYDPCAPGSRLGIRRRDFPDDPQALAEALAGVTSLHWHNLCERNADALERTVAAVEEHFAELLPKVRMVNFGGGHHITRPDYDVERLIAIIDRFQQKWGVQVYLEPGEAVALNAGYLVTTVLDAHDAEPGEIPNVIIDASAPAHMPDVLEMPYRPHIVGSSLPGEAPDRPHACRVGGLSCLAGDVAGEYAFAAMPRVGGRLVFTDMAIYTMVKTNTFNGVQLPDIALYHPERDELETLRRFDYADFRDRLA